MNVLGSFVCQCYSGFMLAEDGKRCVGEYSSASFHEEGQVEHREEGRGAPQGPSCFLLSFNKVLRCLAQLLVRMQTLKTSFRAAAGIFSYWVLSKRHIYGNLRK